MMDYLIAIPSFTPLTKVRVSISPYTLIPLGKTIRKEIQKIKLAIKIIAIFLMSSNLSIFIKRSMPYSNRFVKLKRRLR